MLEFLDSKYSHLIYGPGASADSNGAAPARYEPPSLSLSEMDTSPEAVARKEEQLRLNQLAYEKRVELMKREQELLDQWKKEQMEGN